MKSQKPSENSTEESLRVMNQCPVCKGSYQPVKKNILRKKGDAHLIHITCPHCSNSVMAVVLATPVGLSSVGMVTDLKANDVLRVYNQEAISEDELLGFHQLLKTNRLLHNNIPKADYSS
ncbi:MAG: hypothetical protein ABIJ23_05410 [Candidatus Magasanikbacteria bacterium]